MRSLSFSVLAALAALAGTAVYALNTNDLNENLRTSTAPLYLFSSPSFTPFQSPPLVPTSPDSLSYSSIPSLLSHATGKTKNQSPIGVQEWASNQFFLLPKPVGSAKAVAAINVLGVDSEFGQQILEFASPTFMVKGVPTSAQDLKKTLSDLAESIRLADGSHVTRQHKEIIDGGYLDLVIDSKIEVNLSELNSAAKEVVDSFRDRFHDLKPAGLDVTAFDVNVPADAAFIVEVEYVANLFEKIGRVSGEPSTSSEFAGLIMGGVQKIANHHKRDSVQYSTACAVVRDLMEKTVIPEFFKAFGDGATVALLLSPSVSHLVKRADVPVTPAAVSAVFRLGNMEECAAKDSAGCATITNSCNGRGACVQKKTDCWVCKCNVVADSAFKGNTAPAQWSGNACQYKDTVAEFHLLWGTGIALSILVFGVTMFLISMGGSMDSGPMVAMSGGSPGIKVD